MSINQANSIVPEATFVQSVVEPNGVIMPCEFSFTYMTGRYRYAMPFNLIPDVVDLRKRFTSVVISDVTAEVRQESLIGTDSGDLSPAGHIYVSVIPSGKNTDAQSGTSPEVVMTVRRKQAFPLSVNTQVCTVFKFNLQGFETDLAQDPRRQQGPVAWIGNSGIVPANDGETVSICSVTWYFNCTCSGIAASW